MKRMVVSVLLALCGSSWARTNVDPTHISGSLISDRPGVYGIKGQASASNVPGARSNGVTWTGADGSLWLFGGYGFADEMQRLNWGLLNDLWKFDGTYWTWVSGSNFTSEPGVYGTQGIADSANVPGARDGAVSWIDSQGHLWLFGGYTSIGLWSANFRNDLWKFDGAKWTWVSGSVMVNQSGNYGVKGVASPENVPGARAGSVSWIDGDGNLWLFGGNSGASFFNDLWKFDGVNWIWVSGSSIPNQPPVYGQKGVTHPMNVPGARTMSFSWIDDDNNLWLFGGLNYSQQTCNDLWKFDGMYWTWMSGSNVGNHPGVCRLDGIADPEAMPPGACDAACWTDQEGNFWFYSGSLWKFDGTDWTWVRGVDENGPVLPTPREGAVGWSDGNSLWFFGGSNRSSNMRDTDYFNDLWEFEICETVYNLQDFESFASSWMCVNGHADFNPVWDIALPVNGWVNMSDLLVFCEMWLR